MKTIAIIRPASVDVADSGQHRYITALFTVDGIQFESEIPVNAGEASSINRTISLINFPAMPPPPRFPGLFQ